jgi:hypothetical protein
MKLGVLVVYYLEERDAPLLDLHLKYIEKNTRTHAYKIYAAVNRLHNSLYHRLSSFQNLEICNLPDTELRSSWEHGYYLDALVDYALKDGVSYICTLDVDSFPIRNDWVDVLLKRLSDENKCVAVLRKENGDTALPHPSCTFFHRSFYERYRPSFFPTNNEIQTEDFQTFLAKARQTPDTGIGYGYILFKNKLKWSKLLRSNTINDHFLMAGIYDDIIFHLGSATRKDKGFFRKAKGKGIGLHTAEFINQYIMYCPLNSIRKTIVDFITNHAESRYAKTQAEKFEEIRFSLLNDPDSYLNYLRYGR